MARIRRASAPRAGGGCAALRSAWGGRAHRRRQAHEQGLAVCGVLGDGATGKSGDVPLKRDSQGSGPLSGCGQSPPFPLRDDFVDTAVPWSAGRHASVPRRAARPPFKGKPPRKQLSPAINPKIRRAIFSSAFAPQGQTASNTHPRSAPCPTGARQRRPTRRRRQAPAREPATVCPRARPKRNAPQPACPRRMGQTGVTPAPTALSAGTAGPPPQKPPQTTGSCS